MDPRSASHRVGQRGFVSGHDFKSCRTEPITRVPGVAIAGKWYELRYHIKCFGEIGANPFAPESLPTMRVREGR
jgi:hypothetical protein